MDKLLDDKNKIDDSNLYKIPTHDELVQSMKEGPFIGKCKLCKQVIKSLTLETFNQHKCNG